MATTPSPDESRRPKQIGTDFSVDFIFEPQPATNRPSSQLPHPQILGVPEHDYPHPALRPPAHVLWQRPFSSSLLSPTKPLSITQKPPHIQSITQETKPSNPDTMGDEHPKVPEEGRSMHTIGPPQSILKHTPNLEPEKNPTQPQLQATQPLPGFHEMQSTEMPEHNRKKQPRAPSEEPSAPHKQPASNSDFSPVELEKIGAIPVPHRVNRQFSEQKKLRGTLTLMAWAFSLTIFFTLALAGLGGWELWQRITSAETLAGSINSDLRTQIRDATYRLAELESSLKETRATASTLSDLRREETSERRLLRETMAALTIRLEELESNANNRLRSVALSEQEVQNLRKELAQLRDSLTTNQNRTASDISTLQRRIESIENFLTRATQRSQQQQQQRR